MSALPGSEPRPALGTLMPAQRQPSPPLPDVALYRLLIENLPQSAVYLFDHDLRYLLAEGEALRAAGLTDMVGKHLSDVASGSSLEVLEEHYRAALEGVESDFEHPGEDLLRWYRVRIRPVRDAAGEIVAGLVVTDDVTESRADREEVRASQTFQETIFATSPDIVTIFDLDHMQTLWASRSFDEMFGRSLTDTQALQATGMSSLLHPDDVEVFADDMRRVAMAADGEVLEGSARVLCADGSLRVLARRSTPFGRDDHGRVIHVLNVSWDMTSQSQAAADLDNVRSFQQAVIATTPDPILLVDLSTATLVWASRDLAEVIGWEFESVDQLTWQTLVHPDDATLLHGAMVRSGSLPDTGVEQVRYRLRHRDGRWIWVAQRGTPFARDEAGHVTQLLVMMRDISDVVHAEQELRHSALHDQLTGLANRRLVTDRLEMALAVRTHGGQVAALFLDLDDFKAINDDHGHLVGDVVLTALAARISAAVRPSDTVGRMGGDEFVVLLAATDAEDLGALAEVVAERIRGEVGKPIRHEGQDLRVGVSIGVAFAVPGDDVDSVLSRADHGMYAEKDRHRTGAPPAGS